MKIKEFFELNNKVAIGFSGGVDSSYLLYVAKQCGADIRAYYLKTPFQPEFEYQDAMRLADKIGVEVNVVEYDILSENDVAINEANRCYQCKKRLFGEIVKRACKDGYNCVIDGTNASDISEDRPGMRALNELSVKSPLRECGLTKTEIRKLSKEAGLFTWNKPSYSCLATRIPTGERITADLLCRVEKAENELFKMNFSDFRVRYFHNATKLQFIDEQIERAVACRSEICERLLPYFDEVLLDMKGRK